MSGMVKPSRRPAEEKENDVTTHVMMSENVKMFLESLSRYIEHEKGRLQCPDQGPDEQRYYIYSDVFDKVIEYTAAYKRLLSVIKQEYDEVIRAARRVEEHKRLADHSQKAMGARPISLKLYLKHVSQLKERLARIQRKTAKMEEELQRLQVSRRDTNMQLVNPEDEEVLARHLQHLGETRDALLAKKQRHYIAPAAKADLDTKMKVAGIHKEELIKENHRLHLLYKRLSFVNDSLSCWVESRRAVPLKQFICSTLEKLSYVTVTDTDYQVPDWVAFVVDDPLKFQEFMSLVDYLDRFEELLAAGEYNAAALHAAMSPHGVLCNTHTMDRFKAAGGFAPLVLFIQALLSSNHNDERFPEELLSVEIVRCALEHNLIELVTHAITQRRLTVSEDMGDVLSEHAQKEPDVAEMCLTLACVIYQAFHAYRKAALSMCRRGLNHEALEYIYHCHDFTTDDCLWVWSACPSVSLLHLLTESFHGREAMLSLGQICTLLLLRPQCGDAVLQLLESLSTRGGGALERGILEDTWCSVEGWTEIASFCTRQKQRRLSQKILAALLSQSGTARISPDPEGAKLMEHVFM